jgi:uncharacterized OsmC-like protein
VRGEIENEDGVLVIKRIHVLFHLKAPASARETVERVHGFYAQKCPVYRSIHKAIDVTTDFELEEPSKGPAETVLDRLPKPRRSIGKAK